MEKTIGTEYKNIEQRVEFLKDNCNEISPFTYLKHFNQSERAVVLDNLCENEITLRDLEMKKQEFLENHKKIVKPLLVISHTLIECLKSNGQYVTEDCFKFIDHSESTVGLYNSDGFLIYFRPAEYDELQQNLFSVSKSGTFE
jgi:hypothetical protein